MGKVNTKTEETKDFLICWQAELSNKKKKKKLLRG